MPYNSSAASSCSSKHLEKGLASTDFRQSSKLRSRGKSILVFNGTITGTPALATGSGTENDPYQISTAEGLKWFRDKVNNAKTPDETKICAVLTADIDLNNEEWTPIGPSESSAYTGTFDGQGHTVRNLSITGDVKRAGLFGCVIGGAIRKLTVAGSVSCTVDQGWCGGIAGYAERETIENCASLCTVSYTGKDARVGGIVGYVPSSSSMTIICDCYNIGNITGSSDTGGICGYNLSGRIFNCYNVGEITGSGYVSKIAVSAFNNNRPTNCYYLSDTDTDLNGTAKTAAEFANGDVLKLLKADRDDSPWDSCQYVATAGITLPVFKGQGDAHDHTWSAWTSNGDGTHSRRCTCNAVETVNCSGGKATCKDKAICEICGDSYGSLDPNNHADLKHIDAKAATAAEEGNIEYWHCGDCNKYFSDAAAKTEITEAATVTAKLPPQITAGDGAAVTQGEKKELTFTSDASFADFVRVELDGTVLDEKNYTKREGSTIITLNRDFVATLSVGEHTLAIVSQHGTATAKFTVKAKPAETATPQPTVTPQPTAQPTQTAQPQPTVQPVSPIPRTGDTANPALWFALLIVSGSALAAIFVLRRKANRK